MMMSETDPPRFALAYTSARPAAIGGVLDLWFGRARGRDRVSAAVAVDSPDMAAARAAIDAGRWASQTSLSENHGPRNCVAGWNRAAEASVGDVIIAISDDFVPPEAWDEELIRSAPEGWWTDDRVVAVRDGNTADILTLPIITRRRLQRFGYLLHPSYSSLFSDTELTAVAYLEGAVINARHLLFEHRHHHIGKRPRDAVDRRHSSALRWREGQRLFEARQQSGYPAEPRSGLPAPVSLGTTLGFAVHVLAARDGFCLRESVASVLRQSATGLAEVRAVYLHCPEELWSGKANPVENLDEVVRVADALRAEFPRVEFVTETLPVRCHRETGGRREELETRVRNSALARIRRDGHGHVLVVDSDEIWRKGTLERLVRGIRAHRPASFSSLMLPVVGLPGYPVDRARDKATIYIGPHACFFHCRGSCPIRRTLEGRNVIHFTATRRTMDEIVRKHRESGHYDNPDYDFEGWIKDVLPRIGPGLRGAHMYRPTQIWPEVRRWSAQEWSELPASLHPYLGRETESAAALLARRIRRVFNRSPCSKPGPG
jgi:hypothetical protein